jgi:hypothetical protein
LKDFKYSKSIKKALAGGRYWRQRRRLLRSSQPEDYPNGS